MQAKLKRKDFLAFFKNSDRDSYQYFDDLNERDNLDKQKLLKEFKNLLSRSHNPKYFSTPLELAEEIEKALINIYRDGVISLTSKISTLEVQLSEKDRLISELQQKNTRIQVPTNVQSHRGLISGNLPKLGAFRNDSEITNIGLGECRRSD